MSNIKPQIGHRIVTKWFQPYNILESAKKYFDVIDYTFDGRTKIEYMEKFITEINSSEKITLGLYMKNVNKFYLLILKPETEEISDVSALENLLFKNNFNSAEKYDNDEWIKITENTDEAFNLIDIGKAEASFIMKLG